MPHIVHDAAVFVVYSSNDGVIEALASVPEQYRHQLVGPAGGTNGYYSVAVLPSGGSPRAFDHTAAFEAVWAALKDVDPDLEAVRFTFGGDDERTAVRFTTDELVRVVDATPIPDPRSAFFASEDLYSGAWSRVQPRRT